MATRSLAEEAKQAFQEIYADIPEVRGILIATFEGLPVVSDLKGGLSADKLAALTATALSVGKRIMPSLGMGEVTELTISSNEGKLFLYLVGSSAVLCILAPRGVNLGMMFLKAGEVARSLAAFG
jgi:hypothetical protein